MNYKMNEQTHTDNILQQPCITVFKETNRIYDTTTATAKKKGVK